MEHNKNDELLKEIEDINMEQKYIKELSRESRLKELNDFLQSKLSQKYFFEKAIHNSIYHRMPLTVQENANNAYVFLEKMKREKEAELLKE